MDETNEQVIKFKDNLQILIRITHKQPVLIIHMKNWQALQFYELSIDHQYIQKHTDMSCLFQSPIDLYFTMVELFNELQFKEEGTITLLINLNAVKINKTKKYVLKMSKSEKGQSEMYKINLQKLKRENSEDKYKNEGIILNLRNQLQNIQRQMATIKRQQITNNEELSIFKELNQQKDLQINTKTQEISKLLASCSQLQNKILRLTHQNQSQSIQITNLKTILSQLRQQGHKKLTYINQQNPHLYHFHYKYTEKSLIVIKKSENGWTNFVCNFPIVKDYIATFTIKLLKIRDGSILYGVATKNIFGSNNMDHNEALCYFCRDGRLFQNCLRRTYGPPITVNSTLAIKIDNTTEKVSWLIEGQKIGEEDIPIQMKNKQLFFVVRLFWKDDQFEIFP